jgi:SecD/SecF fusion protein
LVTKLGDLQFRIQVLPDAAYGNESEGARKRTRTRVWDGDAESFRTYKEAEVKLWEAAEAAGTAYVPSRPDMRVVPREGRPANSGPDGFYVLEEPRDPLERFDGGMVTDPSVGKGERGEPVTLFAVKTGFQGVFETWTGRNVGLPMAIVLNGEVRSAPTINSALRDHVQVTLGEQSYQQAQREAKELTTVLQTGSLKMRPVLESTTKTGARLAGESRERGVMATVVALALVLVFMLVFYHWMGLVANAALILNLVLLLGALAAFQAALSLPGIAGIVLTLGVAVDANILINERIREERAIGRNMHRALAEGYSRALTTIVDANMTSVITAVFLYAYGSGAIRGFAVSLTLGLLISMFTAVFVTRAIFEWQLKRGSLKEVGGLKGGRVPSIRWMALRRVLVPISVLGVIFGFAAFFLGDPHTIYDIDFTGGQKWQLRFHERTTVDEVKQALRGEPVDVEVSSTFFDADKTLQTRRQTVKAGPYADATVFSVGAEERAVEIKVQRATARRDLTEEEEAQALEGFFRARFGARLLPPWTRGDPKPYAAPESPAGEEPPPLPAPAPAPAPDGAPAAPADPAAELKEVEGGVTFDMAFVDGQNVLTAEALDKVLTGSFPAYRHDGQRRAIPASQVKRAVVVRETPGGKQGVRTFDVWLKTTPTEGDDVIDPKPSDLKLDLGDWLESAGFREALKAALPTGTAVDGVSLSSPFPSRDQISPSVAKQLRDDALVALLLSFLGIIVYVAVRFSSRAMGLASVLCLFHDVAVTLGVVVVCNAAGLVDAKIDLTMVAAFLTLVGLSINDTVVIYDRIRENRGKRPTITSAMIDLSINQTLGRTLKTITTILITCVALFVFNVGQRNVLEGFAFCLIVGSVVGTYSTVAIASPLLLYLPWIWEKVRWAAPGAGLVGACTRHVALALLLPLAVVVWLLHGLLFALYAVVVGIALFTPWALGVEDPKEVAA